MKEIKVFLASSEELEQDREAFGNFIRRLDNLYEKRGIRIKLFEWEDLDSAYNDERKQDEYNKYIKQSDLFLALFRTKAGKFTVEEFELARDEHREKGLPKPHVYCRDLNEGETEDKRLSDFKKMLFEEMGYFFVRYKNKDGLNLHFVMQLQIFENSLENKVDVDGDKLVYEGISVGRVDNIDFFAKNKDFIRMREDLKDLDKDIIKLRLRLEKYPEDKDFQIELQEKLNKRNALQEEFEHYRKQILNIERRIIELQGQEINEAVKRAMEAFAEGEVNKADIILSEATQGVAQRREEYIEHKKTGEQMRKNLLADIYALLLKAETVLSNTEKTIEERISEALNAYREADKTAKEIDCPAEKYIDLLNKYGVFLDNYAYYEESIEVNLRFIQLSEATNGQNETTAGAYNNIGVVYNDLGDYDKALEYYNKALEIRKSVLGENHHDTATSYNNIGLVYRNLGNYDKALEYHNKALEYHNKALGIYKSVLGENHSNTATSYDSIGIVYGDLGNYDKALEYHKKALEIKKSVLGENHPNTANSYNNIGVVYHNLGDYDKALEYYNNALEIKKSVLGENHPDTANPYNNIGVIYGNLGDYDKALEYLKKALGIYKAVLGESHPYTQQTLRNITIAKQNSEESQGKTEEPK
ncbi:MAG: tetratricopeptide repeat protein [Bacteroidales bacterium]|nr:tetratricopeptide repeat protein [Bacteroidales bacterium]